MKKFVIPAISLFITAVLMFTLFTPITKTKTIIHDYIDYRTVYDTVVVTKVTNNSNFTVNAIPDKGKTKYNLKYEGDLVGKAAQVSLVRYNNLNLLVPALNPEYLKTHNIPKSVSDYANNKVQTYINNYRDIAYKEELKSGVPASITLAQGILESSAGTSILAKKYNNHFGLKCFDKHCPKGHCVNYADDTPRDRFLVFNSAEESFIAHSNRLTTKGRYSACFNRPRSDYKGWSHSLQKAGYATSKKYAVSLIRIIEFYGIYPTFK